MTGKAFKIHKHLYVYIYLCTFKYRWVCFGLGLVFVGLLFYPEILDNSIKLFIFEYCIVKFDKMIKLLQMEETFAIQVNKEGSENSFSIFSFLKDIPNNA